jgi:hypothetical protein
MNKLILLHTPYLHQKTENPTEHICLITKKQDERRKIMKLYETDLLNLKIDIRIENST